VTQAGRAEDGVEARIATLLLVGAVAGIALVAIGVLLMAAAGMSPLADSFPPFDAASVLPDLVALRPEGFLWSGIVIVIATPIARVIGEFVTFALAGDRIMALAALAILAVVASSVIVAVIVEG
jgi:uncharacterized membrane protein